jgi:phage terminase large subunit GpA-like protein
MRVLSRSELAEQAELLAEHRFCQSAATLAAVHLDRLLPRAEISTLEWSVKYRKIRKPDGTLTGWSPDLTPFAVPIMAALDDPEIPEIVVPKPSRCGGTMIAENHALKRLDYGPSGDIGWYLAGPEEVRSYADRVLSAMFEDHTRIAKRIGEGRSDNNKTRKRVSGQTFELMVMSGKTTTNRQFAFGVFDEPDSYHRDYRSNWLEQGRQRQRMLGNARKLYGCAHADVGWSGGIAAAWVVSTQGIWVMQCPQCGGWGSPYPTKYWAEVPRFRLWYEKCPEGAPIDQRLQLAERSAAILCPHNGCALHETERAEMVKNGAFMHKGQSLDIKAGIVGDPEKSRTWGFWVHVLMSQQVGLGELAREIEGALEHKQRTGRSDKLKQVMVRTFGEVFEGAGDAAGLDARALKKRTAELAEDVGEAAAVTYRMGTVPEGVKFQTMAIDVGGGKFDILVRGWDLQRRSWIVDRRTIRQRLHPDGSWRDIAPSKDQADWAVLEAEIDRLVPFAADPDLALPIACTMIDASDGNVTWKAYEFARRMDKRRWGVWRKVRCIKGSTSAKAEPLPPSPTKISKDNEGKPVEPVVTLHVLGVHKLKESALEDLAIDDRSPGHCYFPGDMRDKHFEELFNEVPIDLMGYTEAARLLLQPDRTSINWADPNSLPIWAKPVSLQPEGGDPQDRGDEAPANTVQPKRGVMERFEALNQR